MRRDTRGLEVGRYTKSSTPPVRRDTRGLEVLSDFRNRGCSAQALGWFREQGFTTIVANGVGTLDEDDDGNLVRDIATMYWAHMKAKGLVDVLLDNEGTELEVDAEGNVGFKPQVQKMR